ncbi:hypothetical protein QJQ45_021500 [Haematococcus lacustris]|nr:hypothetical protein QJQ45_021500 [Haematococcus lacustris]
MKDVLELLDNCMGKGKTLLPSTTHRFYALIGALGRDEDRVHVCNGKTCPGHVYPHLPPTFAMIEMDSIEPRSCIFLHGLEDKLSILLNSAAVKKWLLQRPVDSEPGSFDASPAAAHIRQHVTDAVCDNQFAVRVSLGLDWVSINKKSVGVIVMQLVDVPDHVRGKDDTWAILGVIIDNKTSADSHVTGYMKPIFEAFQGALGTDVSKHVHLRSEDLGDRPTVGPRLAAWSGGMQAGANMNCMWCWLSTPKYGKEGVHPMGYVEPVDAPTIPPAVRPPTPLPAGEAAPAKVHMMDACMRLTAEEFKLRGDLVKAALEHGGQEHVGLKPGQHGCNRPALILEFLRYVEGTWVHVVPIAHSLLFGLVKNHLLWLLSTKENSPFDTHERKLLEERFKHIRVPVDYGRQPHHSATCSAWIMDDYMNFLKHKWEYVFLDIMKRSTTNRRLHFELWEHLVQAVLHYLTPGFMTTLTNLLRKDFGLKFCSIEPSEEPYRLPNCSFPAFEVTVTASSRDPNHKAAMLGLLGETITAEGKLAAVPCVQQEGKGYTLVTRRPLLTCTPPTLPQVAISVQASSSKLGAKGQVATRFTGAVQYAVTKARTSPSRAHLTSTAFILCSAVATAQEEGNYLKVQFTSPCIASAVEQAGPITIQATDSVLMKWTPAASSQAQGLNTRTCLELGVSPASINSSSLDSQGGLAATVQRLGSAISNPFLLKRFSNQGTPQTIDVKKVTAEGDSGVAHFVGFYTRTGPVSLLSGATQLASFRRDSKRVPLCLIPANVGMSAALICTVAGMARSHRTILKDSTGRPITAAMHPSSFCGGGQVETAARTVTITSIHTKLEGAFHQFRDAGKLAQNTLSEAQETSLAKIFEACQPLLTAIAAYTQAEDSEDKATHRGSMRTTVDTIYAHMKEAPAAPRRPFPAAHQQKGNKQRPQQPRPVDKAAAAAAIAPAESQGPSPSSKREPMRQASARSPTHGASTSRALAADMEAAASDAAKAMATTE